MSIQPAAPTSDRRVLDRLWFHPVVVIVVGIGSSRSGENVEKAAKVECLLYRHACGAAMFHLDGTGDVGSFPFLSPNIWPNTCSTASWLFPGSCLVPGVSPALCTSGAHGTWADGPQATQQHMDHWNLGALEEARRGQALWPSAQRGAKQTNEIVGP
ncbi:uncharacterized protein SPSK_09966 [Sporothrix schenckii 1099-18]|uniref:Uncharacterized protein n=1 Tax=Sporothrix schenckii 1099-18 TaxID=1397361 RepID=A0A0F2M607_SPOSC|nr:uncharacterized protein SPSK_09966 [Sporothrix schenckii 1099-18]KJR85062.1 hypothetical protein SPSK_09966 [Sporothrix schenckii 1099-18]